MAARRCVVPLLRARASALHRIDGSVTANRLMSTTPGKNPKVFFDCDVGGKPAGRITFELFADVVPKVTSRSIFTYEVCTEIEIFRLRKISGNFVRAKRRGWLAIKVRSSAHSLLFTS